MRSRFESQIINELLDKFERSKSFIGDNKVNQRFMVKVSSLFPQYADHSNYEAFNLINEAIDILIRKQFIFAQANSAKVYKDIVLNLNSLEQVYNYVGRSPKKDTNSAILHLMEKYKLRNPILMKYCETQCERIALNKPVQFFNNDLSELENILIAVDELLKVEIEIFVRDFSVRVFRDSKIFEALSSKVINLLYEYGDFPDKDQVLGNLNIIKNPT